MTRAFAALLALLLLGAPAQGQSGSGPVVIVPASGPDGSADTSEDAWARAARVQRADILSHAAASAEAKERFATLIDCSRYAMDFTSRASFDADMAGMPRNATCQARFNTATEAFRKAGAKALPLNEMDLFQYENSGLILDRDEMRRIGDGPAQRRYLIGKVEACFARFGGTDALPASLPADCPLSPDGAPLAD